MANPIAMIASFGMCLRYSFGMVREADLLEQAIAAVLGAGAAHRATSVSDGMTQGRHAGDGRGDPRRISARWPLACMNRIYENRGLPAA